MTDYRLTRRNYLLLIVPLILVVLSSCSNVPSEGIPGEDIAQDPDQVAAQAQQDDQQISEVLPSILCSAEELEPPVLRIPHHGQKIWANEMVYSLPAEFFQWKSISCLPEKYKIYFTDDPTWGTSWLGQTDGQTSWPDPEAAVPSVPLEPATQYWWKVRAWTEGVEGPDSNIGTFYTGPLCHVHQSNLGAPELIAPLDGQTIASPSVMLRYKPGYPGCLPGWYRVNVQTSADFSGTSLGPKATSSQAVHLHNLQDCTTYYWAVKARHSPVHPSDFPWSDVYSFITDIGGTCSLDLKVIALQDLACYQGPNASLYSILGYLLQGETAEVVAQSLDMNWWYIRNPDGPENCAVPKDQVEDEGDTEDIPLWNNPDLAPESEGGSGGDGLACSRYTTQMTCEAAGCKWDAPDRTLGTCINP